MKISYVVACPKCEKDTVIDLVEKKDRLYFGECPVCRTKLCWCERDMYIQSFEPDDMVKTDKPEMTIIMHQGMPELIAVQQEQLLRDIENEILNADKPIVIEDKNANS